MRVAVTGGDGFLGRSTMAAGRQAGHDMVSFDLPAGDILGDLSALDGADAVIHLAGLLGTHELFDLPETAVAVNVTGTLRVLERCRQVGVRYVGVAMHDKFPSVYGATRNCAQRLAEAWHQAYGLPVCHVRAFNAYGPGQAHGPGHPQKLVPTLATCGWRGEPLPIWGDGEQVVDLGHAHDVGRMLVEAVGYGGGEVFDAGTGVAVTVNQLAKFVIGVTGSSAGVQHLPMRRGEVPADVIAHGEGWDVLGWHPELDWDRIAETIRWYRR